MQDITETNNYLLAQKTLILLIMQIQIFINKLTAKLFYNYINIKAPINPFFMP